MNDQNPMSEQAEQLANEGATQPTSSNPNEDAARPSNGNGSMNGAHQELAIITGLQDSLAAATKEIESLKDQLARALADHQNARRRAEAEKQAMRAYATEAFVLEILPALDNLERSIKALDAGSSVDAVLEGVKGVEKQFRSVLESHRVHKIHSVGQPFDPEIHDAVATEHSDEHDDDIVSQEIEAGYKMHDKIIRPARVKVVKKA